MTRVNLAENYLALGDHRRAKDLLDSVYRDSKRPEFHWNRFRWRSRCLLDMSQLALRKGDPSTAQSHLDEALADGWIDGFPMKKYQVRAARLRGKIQAATGDIAAAKRSLGEALARARDLAFPTQLWLTHRAFGDVLVKLSESEARTQYGEARSVAQAIADGLKDPGLKQDFLSSEPIRSLFAQAETR